MPRSPQFKNVNSMESRVKTEKFQKTKLAPFMSIVFNLLDEAVSAIPVCRHLPSIGWYLVQAPGSWGRWPAWRLRPVAGGKKKSLHQTPGNFFSDKFHKGHGTCSSQLRAVYSADYMNDWDVFRSCTGLTICLYSILLAFQSSLTYTHLVLQDEETMNSSQRLSNSPEDTQAYFECSHLLWP